jgi:hypothetical protein
LQRLDWTKEKWGEGDTWLGNKRCGPNLSIVSTFFSNAIFYNNDDPLKRILSCLLSRNLCFYHLLNTNFQKYCL